MAAYGKLGQIPVKLKYILQGTQKIKISVEIKLDLPQYTTFSEIFRVANRL